MKRINASWWLSLFYTAIAAGATAIFTGKTSAGVAVYCAVIAITTAIHNK